MYSRAGVPIQRPGIRSLRSSLTNLPLITAPVKSHRSTKVGGGDNNLSSLFPSARKAGVEAECSVFTKLSVQWVSQPLSSLQPSVSR